jgi:hypothetical protein
MYTIADIRRVLVEKNHPHSLPLLDAIERRAKEDPKYNTFLNNWLTDTNRTYSTVYMRDVLCLPHKDLPEVVAAGENFNPSTKWDNVWIPLDTAKHILRMRHEASTYVPAPVEVSPGCDVVKTREQHKRMCRLPDAQKQMFALNWRMPHTLFNLSSTIWYNDDLQKIDWNAIYMSRDIGLWEDGNKVYVI